MSTLEDAFKQGQEAHQAASEAKAEIKGMFADLSQVVQAGTGGKVRIEFGTLNRTKHLARGISAGLLGVLPETEEYDALIAARIDGASNQRSELCSVKLSPHGYPVEFKFPGSYATAEDRESLETALARLLAHPDIGGKIAALARI